MKTTRLLSIGLLAGAIPLTAWADHSPTAEPPSETVNILSSPAKKLIVILNNLPRAGFFIARQISRLQTDSRHCAAFLSAVENKFCFKSKESIVFYTKYV